MMAAFYITVHQFGERAIRFSSISPFPIDGVMPVRVNDRYLTQGR